MIDVCVVIVVVAINRVNHLQSPCTHSTQWLDIKLAYHLTVNFFKDVLTLNDIASHIYCIYYYYE